MKRIALFCLIFFLIFTGCSVNPNKEKVEQNTSEGNTGTNNSNSEGSEGSESSEGTTESTGDKTITSLNLDLLTGMFLPMGEAYSIGIGDETMISSAGSRGLKSGNVRNIILCIDEFTNSIYKPHLIAYKDTESDNEQIHAGDSYEQEELNAVVDKLYVDDAFTYISFVVDYSQLDLERFEKRTEAVDDPTLLKINRHNQTFGDPHTINDWNSSSKSYDSCPYGLVKKVETGLQQTVETYSIQYMEGSEIKTEELTIRPKELVSSSIDGIAIYDTYGYESSALRKSFIVDNKTGLFYLIEGFSLSISNGLPYVSDQGIVHLSIADDNLVIRPYCRNFEVYSYFKDRYGQVYIQYDGPSSNRIDEELNCVYFKSDALYVLAENGDAIFMDFAGPDGGLISKPGSAVAGIRPTDGYPLYPKNIYVMGDNFERTIVGESYNVEINKLMFQEYFYTAFVDRICNGRLMIFMISDGRLSTSGYENTVSWTEKGKWDFCKLPAVMLVVDGNTRIWYKYEGEDLVIFNTYCYNPDGSPTQIFENNKWRSSYYVIEESGDDHLVWITELALPEELRSKGPFHYNEEGYLETQGVEEIIRIKNATVPYMDRCYDRYGNVTVDITVRTDDQTYRYKMISDEEGHYSAVLSDMYEPPIVKVRVFHPINKR